MFATLFRKAFQLAETYNTPDKVNELERDVNKVYLLLFTYFFIQNHEFISIDFEYECIWVAMRVVWQ